MFHIKLEKTRCTISGSTRKCFIWHQFVEDMEADSRILQPSSFVPSIFEGINFSSLITCYVNHLLKTFFHLYICTPVAISLMELSGLLVSVLLELCRSVKFKR